MPNLTTNMPDLNSMFAGGMSVFPAMQAADQYQMAMQNQGINQASALQDMFHTEQKMPLELQRMQLANQTSQAQLPGVQAQSELLGQRSKRGAATLDTDIEADLSDNYTKLDKNQTLRLKEFADKLGMLATAGERGLPMADMMSLPPQFRQLLGKPGGAAQLRKLAEDMRGFSTGLEEKLALQEAMMKRQMAVEDEKSERSRYLAAFRGQVQEKLQAARMAAQGDKPANTYEAVGARLTADYLAETDPEKRAILKNAADRANDFAYEWKERLARARATGKIDVGAVADLPVQQSLPPPKLGGDKPQGAGGDTDVFKQAFGAYEPDKYEYRIGPNGKPQRKAKGQ